MSTDNGDNNVVPETTEPKLHPLASYNAFRLELAQLIGLNPACGILWLPYLDQVPSSQWPVDTAKLGVLLPKRTTIATHVALILLSGAVAGTVIAWPSADVLSLVAAILASIVAAVMTVKLVALMQKADSLRKNPPVGCRTPIAPSAGYRLVTVNPNDATKVTDRKFPIPAGSTQLPQAQPALADILKQVKAQRAATQQTPTATEPAPE